MKKALYNHPEDAQAWGDSFYELAEAFPANSDLRLRSQAILFELENEANSATIAVISRLEKDAKAQGLSSLTQLFLENLSRISTPNGAYAAARLACANTIWNKSLVDQLASFAYENLAPNERDFVMSRIDQHLSLAEVVRAVPTELKIFWVEQFTKGSHETDWETDEAKGAVDFLTTSTARLMPHFQDFVSLLPETVAENLPTQTSRSRYRSVESDASFSAEQPSNKPSWDQGPSWDQSSQAPSWDQGPSPSAAPAPHRRHASTSSRSHRKLHFLWLLIPCVVLLRIFSTSFFESRNSNFNPTKVLPTPPPGFGDELMKEKSQLEDVRRAFDEFILYPPEPTLNPDDFGFPSSR